MKLSNARAEGRVVVSTLVIDSPLFKELLDDANLWRAVDHEGEVLESFVTKARDKAAALKFMKKLMKRHGYAKAITACGPTRPP